MTHLRFKVGTGEPMMDTDERRYHSRILRVLVHIQRNLDDPLDLDKLARIAHFSPSHFHRIFRSMVGETVMAHVRRLRLERAAYLLRYTDIPVLTVALGAGYESQESFTRAFRAVFDDPPASYRRIHRAVAHAPAPSGVHYVPDAQLEAFESPAAGTKLDVAIEQRSPMTVVFTRHVGPYSDVETAWGILRDGALRAGLVEDGSQMLAMIHDDPDVTNSERTRYDACLTVSRLVRPEAPLGFQEISGGQFAVARHRGSYTSIPATYAALFGQWLPQSGHEPRSGPCIEVYVGGRDGPEVDRVCEICVPITRSPATP